MSILSKWNSPGFKGNFLPVDKVIADSGFNARWLVTNLNRNFSQVWSGKAYGVAADSFGVDFILPVDHYQKSLRSAKYGILFIALTFLALIFAENGSKGEYSYLSIPSGRTGTHAILFSAQCSE